MDFHLILTFIHETYGNTKAFRADMKSAEKAFLVFFSYGDSYNVDNFTHSILFSMLIYFCYFPRHFPSSFSSRRTSSITFSILERGWRVQARSQDFRGEEVRFFLSEPKGGRSCRSEKCLKTYMRFGALHCICCIKIINLKNFKNLLLYVII